MIYIGPDTYASADEIRALDMPCPASVCDDVHCQDGNLSFSVWHFTGYAVGSNANLTIYDEVDLGAIRIAYDPVVFSARYVNKSDGTHIAGADCSVAFEDASPSAMTDNGSAYIYTKEDGFDAGSHSWNVSCAKPGYNTLNATDDMFT